MTEGPYRKHSGGVLLSIRLTPKSGRDAVEGAAAMADGSIYLKARVRALPENGAANKALKALLAKWVGLPKSDVEIVAGATSRLKNVLLRGDSEKLMLKLDGLCAAFS